MDAFNCTWVPAWQAVEIFGMGQKVSFNSYIANCSILSIYIYGCKCVYIYIYRQWNSCWPGRKFMKPASMSWAPLQTGAIGCCDKESALSMNVRPQLTQLVYQDKVQVLVNWGSEETNGQILLKYISSHAATRRTCPCLAKSGSTPSENGRATSLNCRSDVSSFSHRRAFVGVEPCEPGWCSSNP